MKLSHSTILGLLIGILLYYLVPVQAETLPRFHERLTWTAPTGNRLRAHYTLEYWASSRRAQGPKNLAECLLRTRLTRVMGGHKRVWRDHDLYQEPNAAAIDVAVAIRVQGQEAPQILVKRTRADWGDYGLYRVDEHGLKETFGISHRDEGCICWVSKHGVLQRLVFFDRWTAQNRPGEPPGKRLQERVVYRYNLTRKTWLPASRRWEPYVFDDGNGGLKNPVFQKPSDCPFHCRLSHNRSTNNVAKRRRTDHHYSFRWLARLGRPA